MSWFNIHGSWFFGVVLVGCLLMGVVGAAVAAPIDTSRPTNSDLERKIFKLECEIDNVYDMQILKIERSNDNFRHMKEWVEGEKRSAENWYNNLTILSVVIGAWITIFGIAVTIFGLYTAKKQNDVAKESKNFLEKEVETFTKKMADYELEIKKELTERKESLSKLANTKEQEFRRATHKCELLLNQVQANKSETDAIIQETRNQANNFIHNANNLLKNDVKIAPFAEPKTEETILNNSPIITSTAPPKEPTNDITSNKGIKNDYMELVSKAMYQEKRREWGKALDIWLKLLEEYPEKEEVVFSLGYIYHNQLNSKLNIAQFRETLQLAEKYYKKASEINPKGSGTWSNLGILLTAKYFIANEKNKGDVFTEANECFSKATVLDPSQSQAWSNWGVLLKNIADSLPTIEKVPFLNNAIEKFQESLKLNPANEAAWNNLANALSTQIELASPEKTDQLQQEAELAYHKALEINPKYQEVWHNLGNLLLRKAVLNKTTPDLDLLNRAKALSLKAKPNESGLGAYNLACIASLQKNFSECQKWLEVSKSKPAYFVNSEHLKNDKDLDNFKNDPEYKQWFEYFLEEIRRKEQEAAEEKEKDTKGSA
ncbi:MAG: hypothetical protein BA863_02305 [Desulfovibrio sp. S3730MH75]|nr:MAG: hypothetical protein BA863_02305 [Desulfovibrio sp. S3730MH75]